MGRHRAGAGDAPAAVVAEVVAVELIGIVAAVCAFIAATIGGFQSNGARREMGEIKGLTVNWSDRLARHSGTIDEHDRVLAVLPKQVEDMREEGAKAHAALRVELTLIRQDMKEEREEMRAKLAALPVALREEWRRNCADCATRILAGGAEGAGRRQNDPRRD